ncbi:MAG: hypothetical protein ACM3O8_06145 [Methylococcaceae bacterium]|nr:hypothetical protein [Prolixibacteraceae bacterium]
MKKFAAHYLLTDTGLLLKNGMAVADDSANIQFIDTKGELTELEQMIYHSGLLIGNCEFIKTDGLIPTPVENENPLQLFDSILNKDQLSLKEVIDLARQFQDQFSGMNIPQILIKTEQALIDKSYIKRIIPGLYLLSGINLQTLHFTPHSRLKKIL